LGDARPESDGASSLDLCHHQQSLSGEGSGERSAAHQHLEGIESEGA